MAVERAICSLCAGEESPGFYTGCMIKDGHVTDWTCDGKGNLSRPTCDEADGFRIEAAVQFGFRWTNDDADEYACTEAALVAFAKPCERKGMTSVVAKLEAADSAVSLEWLANEIHLDIAEIDAELVPVLETERQRYMAAGAKPTALVKSPLCEDEGCPQHGTPHVCINSGESKCADCKPNIWIEGGHDDARGQD